MSAQVLTLRPRVVTERLDELLLDLGPQRALVVDADGYALDLVGYEPDEEETSDG